MNQTKDLWGPVPNRRLSIFQNRVLEELENVERKGLAKLSQPALASMLDTSVKQMENTLRVLRRMGYVVVHDPARGGRNPKPQTYRLTYVPEE